MQIDWRRSVCPVTWNLSGLPLRGTKGKKKPGPAPAGSSAPVWPPAGFRGTGADQRPGLRTAPLHLSLGGEPADSHGDILVAASRVFLPSSGHS